MKKNLFLTLTIAAILCQTAYCQTADNPGDYMTAINNAQTEMRQKYMAYMSAAAHGRRARKIEKMRAAVLESITNCKYKTIEINPYKGDNSLRKSSTDYIDVVYRVFNEDYRHIVDMEEIAEQSFDEMQAYLLLQEKVDEKLKNAADNMEKAGKDFAKKYNVNLISSSDELSDKLATAGKLNTYRNKVYLIFFKCNWQDNLLVQAMNNKKVKDLEQTRSSLGQYAAEGLTALNDCRAFEGDPSLANACRQSLEFYRKMAEKDIPQVTDYFLKEEDFQKLKKNMEAKSDRSRQDVDSYNKSVKEINTAANNFNQLNARLNNGRNQVLQDWNNADKAFTDQHMPVYKR